MPFGLDSFDIYKAMYDREFKFVSRHERRVALFEADPAASPFIEAVFGGFPVDGPLQPLSRAYVDALDPVKLVPNVENWIKVIKEGFRLPLSFTMESLKRDDNGWNEPTLFVVNPTSPLDLIDLWNIRQFHPQILPVNLAWLQGAKEFLNEFVRANYRPLPGNPNGVMIRTTIQFGRSIVSGDHEKAVERGSAILSDIRGRDGARKSLEMLFEAFPDLRLNVEQILASGDHVVVRVRVAGTHKGNFAGIAPTNKSVSWRACNVVEIRNGKAIQGRLYADHASLFQQLGVLSLPKAKAAG